MAALPASFHIDALSAVDGFGIESPIDGAHFGWSLGTTDFNDDGIADLLAGAAGADTSFVIFGRDGFSSIDFNDPEHVVRINGAGNIVNGGDVNGDGIGDILVHTYDNTLGWAVFGTATPTDIDLDELDGTDGFRISGPGLFTSMASADLNEDGFSDLIIGAPDDNGGTGAAYTIFGQNSGFHAIENVSSGITFNGIEPGTQVGYFVGSAGDFNNDGFDDFLIGAPLGNTKGHATGEAFVVFGSDNPVSLNPNSLNGTNGFRLVGIDSGSRAGWVLAPAADVNRDGIKDLVFSSTDAAANGQWRTGVTHVVFGTNDPFPATFDLEQLDGNNGFSIEGVEHGVQHLSLATGDFNGDGYADVVIGSPSRTPDGNVNSEFVYVVFGQESFPDRVSLGVLNGTNGFRIENGISAEDFGRFVSLADMNHDGFDDLVIGQSRPPEGTSGDDGAMFVIYGRASGVPDAFDTKPGVYGTDGNDKIKGAGNLIGMGGDDLLLARAAVQIFDGRVGTDTVTYQQAPTRVNVSLKFVDADYNTGWAQGDFFHSVENLTGSLFSDTVRGSLGDNAIRGLSGNDRIFGLLGADVLLGGGGNDVIAGDEGRDTLNGEAGKDILRGGLGGDVLKGGDLARDSFVYLTWDDSFRSLESTRDMILDFDSNDVIDLGALDASLIGAAQFSGDAGEVRYAKNAGNTHVFGDRDGNGFADFEIVIRGQHTLTNQDFIF